MRPLRTRAYAAFLLLVPLVALRHAVPQVSRGTHLARAAIGLDADESSTDHEHDDQLAGLPTCELTPLPFHATASRGYDVFQQRVGGIDLRLEVAHRVPFSGLPLADDDTRYLRVIRAGTDPFSQLPDCGYLATLGTTCDAFTLPRSGSYLRLLWPRVATMVLESRIILNEFFPPLAATGKDALTVRVDLIQEPRLPTARRFRSRFDSRTRVVTIDFSAYEFETTLESDLRAALCEARATRARPLQDAEQRFVEYQTFADIAHAVINRQLLAALVHECVHYYLSRDAGPPYPPWFEEGVAALAANTIDQKSQAVTYLMWHDDEAERFLGALAYPAGASAIYWTDAETRRWVDEKIAEEERLRAGYPARQYFRTLLRRQYAGWPRIPFDELVTLTDADFYAEGLYEAAYAEAFWLAFFAIQDYKNTGGFEVWDSSERYLAMATCMRTAPAKACNDNELLERAEARLEFESKRELDPSRPQLGFDSYSWQFSGIAKEIIGAGKERGR